MAGRPLRQFWTSVGCSYLIFIQANAFATDSSSATATIDRTPLSLQEASELFSKNNLEIMAGKLKIKAAEAQKLQAGLWLNPNLQIGQNIYNPQTKKYFDATKNGNTDVTLTQTLRLGKKVSSEIEIADLETKLEMANLRDILRHLHHDLRVTFYRIYYQKKMMDFYEHSIASLKHTVSLAERSYGSRTILLSEVLRIKAIVTSLQDQRMDLIGELAESRSRLSSIIWGKDGKSHDHVDPVIDEEKIDRITVPMNIEDSINLARQYRADLQIQNLEHSRERSRIVLEKANSIPDLTLGFQYSRAGSYIPDYYALTFGIDLPVFNRNQGRIQSQTLTAQASEKTRDQSEVELINEVRSAYEKATSFDAAYHDIDSNFLKDYEQLVDQTIKNYEKRNISVIAFADFYEAFQETLMHLNEMQLKRLTAFEDLNQAIGKIITGP